MLRFIHIPVNSAIASVPEGLRWVDAELFDFIPPGEAGGPRIVSMGFNVLPVMLARAPTAAVSNRVLMRMTTAHMRTHDYGRVDEILRADALFGGTVVVYPREVLDAVLAITDAREYDAVFDFLRVITQLPDLVEPYEILRTARAARGRTPT